MKKFKKILTAAITAAITLTATGMAASAFSVYDSDTNPGARLDFAFGYSEMVNLKDKTRYASARVEIVNKYTGTSIKVNTKANTIGLCGSVPAQIQNSDDYRSEPFKSICSGTIHSAGSPYSPTDWEPNCPVVSP